MIHMKSINMKYLAGGPIERVKPLPPYDEKICTFLAELSKKLQKDRRAMAYPDVLSFAFFCRKANIAKLKAEFEDGKKSIIRHIRGSEEEWHYILHLLMFRLMQHLLMCLDCWQEMQM